MFRDRSILAVVPARGGSKGITLKNLRAVNGVPLVAQVGRVVSQLSYIDRAIVSTDHERIARVASGAGLAAPFLRPADISGDRISDWQVLIHALQTMEQMDGRQYDIVLMLQPTSPGRTPQHVTDTVVKLIDGGYDAVWTVSETDSKHHPYKQLVLDGDRLDYYDERGRDIIARQQLQPVYHRNGVAYAITRDCLIVHRNISGRRTSAVVISEAMPNIDTELDLALAEIILKGQSARS